jgi:O-antigen/teichoic acid export membrane protein
MTRPLEASPTGHRHLITGSVWLIVATLVAALGGFAFWLAAAHVDSSTSVGRAAALFTSAMFLNYVTGMGLPIAVARYANDRSKEARVLFEWALAYTAATSAAGAVLFLALVPHSVATPLFSAGYPLGFLLFFVIVTGMSFAILVDMRLMAMRQWGWVVGRAFLVVSLRLPFVWVRPVRNDALWLFLLIGGSQALSGLVGAVVLQRGAWRALLPLPAQARRAFRYASVNYLGQLAIQAPFFVLPLIVLLNVSAHDNAVFYIAWAVMAVVFVTVQMIGQALLVEGGKDGARLGSQVRVALAIAMVFTCLGSFVAYLGSELLTTVYGRGYASASDLLPVLVLGTIGWAITSTYLTQARVLERGSAIIAISVPFALLILLPATFLTVRDGIDGAAQAWLYGNGAAAFVAIAVSYAARVSSPPLNVSKSPVGAHTPSTLANGRMVSHARDVSAADPGVPDDSIVTPLQKEH